MGIELDYRQAIIAHTGPIVYSFVSRLRQSNDHDFGFRT